jgi:hypothetical protein
MKPHSDKQRAAAALYPPLPRGTPHYMTREKQRAAFLAGWEAAKRHTKRTPHNDYP